MQDAVLEMRGVTKRFPGVVALNAVDLDVYPAEVLALIGENGAGKSTLMKILGGVYQPDVGELRIDGQPVVIASVSDALRLGIGFIHQELNVLDNLDVASNIFLGREPVYGGPLRLIDRQRMDSDAEIYIERLGLNLSPRTPLTRLSIAQKQLVEIAKALSQNARLLIMDEPTSSLTLTETGRLLAVVKELRAQGVSIIYISHRLGEIEEIADRVVALRDGQNAGRLAREEIHHDQMVRLMVGRELQNFYVHSDAERQPGYFAIDNLRTSRYPDSQVSFEVAKGEILGVAGLVGAGRSEMAQAIFGTDRAVGGTLKLDNQPLVIKTAEEAIKHGIYLIPEDRRNSGLVIDMTIRENITMPALERYATAGLIQRDKERDAAAQMSKRLNVKAPTVEERVGNLSGGNQQKVVLAKWLSLAPRVLIFDEPTRGIDVGAKAEIYELMRNLAREGVAIMMISSDMEEVLGVSDRVAVMHEGRLTGILEREACSEEAIMRLAVGKPNDARDTPAM
ncbi:MAG: ribose transport system ATP-binding protein [Blastocatellia bacterium]